jgi:hypothetical protein
MILAIQQRESLFLNYSLVAAATRAAFGACIQRLANRVHGGSARPQAADRLA